MDALATFVRVVDRTNDLIGRAVSWLTLLMMLNVCVVVVLRYGFSLGWVWMQEAYVWMHGLLFMVAAGYTLLHNGHVRVDVIYRAASPRYKAWVDLFGSLLLLMPMVLMVFKVAWPYVLESWMRLESSREAGGLPGLYLIKSALIVFCVLLALQGLSLAGRSILVLAGRREFEPGQAEEGPVG